MSRTVILAVDDFPDSLALLSEFVAGHFADSVLLTADSGAEALHLAQIEPIDIVLLDVQMPGMDGFAVCQALKTNPRTQHIPVLMISGALVSSEDRSTGLDLGADGYICKPYERVELVAQMRALLRVKHVQDELRRHQEELESELERRTRHLADSEAQLRVLFNQSPDAIFVEDVKGNVLDANETACVMHGMPRKELIGKNLVDLVPEEAREQAMAKQPGFLRGEIETVESISKTGNGVAIPVEIRGAPVVYAGQEAILFHVHDISDRKRAETELVHEQESLRALLENIPDMIYFKDRESRFTRMNPAQATLLGLSHPDDGVGKTDADFFDAEAARESRADDQAIMDSLIPLTDKRERISTNHNGRTYWLSTTKVPLLDSDAQVTGIVGISRDVTERRETELELAASEEKFSNIFHHSNDAILLCDLDARILDANRTATKMLGFTREEFLAMRIPDLHPAHAWNSVGAKAFSKLQEKGEYRFDVTLLCKDGRELSAEVSASLFEFQGRQVILGVIRDIAERQLAHERQQVVTAGLRAVVEAADELMQCPDVDTLHRRAVELAREKLGIERCSIFVEEGDAVRGTYGTNLNGETTVETQNIQPRTGFWPQCFEPLESGGPTQRVVRDQLGEWNGHRNTIVHQGWIAITPIVKSGEKPAAVFLNDNGISGADLNPDRQDILAVYCSLLGEIIERKQAEERLSKAEARYRTLVEQLPAITYTVRLGHPSRTTYISPQVETLLGYTPEEWQADPELWIRSIHPDDKDDLLRRIEAIDAEGRPYSLEYRLRARDGDYHWFRNQGVFLPEPDGKTVAIHGVMFDITSRKEAEDRERHLQSRLARAQRMESLGILAGGVAHDLNNILGPLVAYPELMLEELDPDSPLRPDVQEISNSAHRASDVIQDLLSLARRGRYQIEPVNLNQVVQSFVDAAETQALSARHADVVLTVDLDHHLPAMKGSAPHLRRVVANLVTNAFEATSAGGRITITTRRQPVRELKGAYDTLPAGDYVILSVKDTGEGISTGDLEHIFEPFYTKRRMGRSGTGIGLAVVYGVVKDLEGYLNVTSKVNVGTEFQLFFPVSEDAAATRDCVVVGGHGNERVLVVDDVPQQRDLAKKILARYGYQVVTKENGHAAIEYLKMNPADLVLLDMIMEEKFDGLDTYRGILQIRPHQRCIIASGFAETDRVREALALGVGAYIRKPYTPEQISSAVREALDRVPA